LQQALGHAELSATFAQLQAQVQTRQEAEAALQSAHDDLESQVHWRTAEILQLGKIGRELTTTLDTEQAFERVYRQVNARLDAYSFSIGIYAEARAQIEFVYKIENGVRQPSMFISMNEKDRPGVWCVREQRELITGKREELLNYVETLMPALYGSVSETVVYLPLMIEQKVIGCLTVQSPKQNAYNQDQLEFYAFLPVTQRLRFPILWRMKIYLQPIASWKNPSVFAGNPVAVNPV